MPFLGRDWRAPGEQWVRTKQGWENLRLWRVKLFENLNENILARLMRLALTDWCVKHELLLCGHQPHVPYIRGGPHERRIPMTLAEVFIRLDMTGAVRDLRRFNYVNNTMKILVGEKLARLSGTAQKHVLNILEHMLNYCLETGTNISCIKKLLESATACITETYPSHLGSDVLWLTHARYIAKLTDRLNSYIIHVREDDGATTISDLPDDCIYQIMSRINDHRDILHVGQTTSSLYELSSDEELWRRLSLFHFTQLQLMTFLPKETRDDNVDWKNLYRRCVRRFGQKHVYADMIALCCRCDTVFWQSRGHPCLAHDTPKHTVLTPQQFVELLST